MSLSIEDKIRVCLGFWETLTDKQKQDLDPILDRLDNHAPLGSEHEEVVDGILQSNVRHP